MEKTFKGILKRIGSVLTFNLLDRLNGVHTSTYDSHKNLLEKINKLQNKTEDLQKEIEVLEYQKRLLQDEEETEAALKIQKKLIKVNYLKARTELKIASLEDYVENNFVKYYETLPHDTEDYL